ncbi:hypothetical protein K1719_016278 [Acacia pycnantha]|nr:hypothetical protein K1719_016278 [Acacia pycnantha]
MFSIKCKDIRKGKQTLKKKVKAEKGEEETLKIKVSSWWNIKTKVTLILAYRRKIYTDNFGQLPDFCKASEVL